MKAILYSPSREINTKDKFFNVMDNACNIGGDLVIFPENVYTPFNELLNSVDILNAQEYDAVLDLLYNFSYEMGCGCVFNATDDFGFNYSLFVNATACKGETYNKLYLKHIDAKLTAFDLDDYKYCISEIFEPIIYRGAKIGMTIGREIFLSKIFDRYIKNDVNYIVNSFSDDGDFEKRKTICKSISQAKGLNILCCGTDGRTICASSSNNNSSTATEYEHIYLYECNNKAVRSNMSFDFDTSLEKELLGNNFKAYNLL